MFNYGVPSEQVIRGFVNDHHQAKTQIQSNFTAYGKKLYKIIMYRSEPDSGQGFL